MHTMKLGYQYPDEYDQHMVESVPVVEKEFDENYPYYKDGLFYKTARFFAYLTAYTVGYVVCLFKHGIRFVGRENLKKHKEGLSSGCVTICNHVLRYDYMCIMRGICPNFQYYPAWNAKLLDKDRHCVSFTGGIPVPQKRAGLRAFFKAFDRHMSENAWIHFFPEAAMWPFYQKIRPFKKGAFSLAVKHNQPILPMAFRFRDPGKLAKFFGAKEPFASLHIGEPIYPDSSIESRAGRVNKLLNDSYRAVERLAGIPIADTLVPEMQ